MKNLIWMFLVKLSFVLILKSKEIKTGDFKDLLRNLKDNSKDMNLQEVINLIKVFKKYIQFEHFSEESIEHVKQLQFG